MCTNPRKLIINNEEITVKCGKCDTCRREKSQEWAIKLICYSKYFRKASFITLTFDNKILLNKNSKAVKKYGAHPGFVFNITESKEYFKKFIKRLRKKFKDTSITYYHVGEYGDKSRRPHHHCLLYGVNFEEDRKEMEVSKSGHIQYYSKTLEELWACGRISVEDINSYNIMYIAQYALKKFKSKNDQYRHIQSYSNRSKMSTRWVRRNFKEIEKGFIEDKDKHRYRIPKSYLETLKKSNRLKHREAYENYENQLLERISNINNADLLELQKRKEIIRKLRNKEKSRDF